MAELPNLDHTCMADWDHVYEPSDDTFLLCDALLAEKHFLTVLRPTVAFEIGCGSGCVIVFLCNLLREAGCNFFATDINPHALRLAARTALHNQARVEFVNTRFLDAVDCRLHHQVDILVFNPPYVPTPDEEVGSNGIEAAWAGGTDGRVDYLSATGVCYLVLVKENRPKQIERELGAEGFQCQIVLRRQAVNEGLMIMKITRIPSK